MILRVLGSSSKGNCYVLDGRTESIIIEAGVNPAEMKRAVDYYYSGVVGCLVSHEHQDHSKYAAEYMGMGIDVFSSRGTFDALGISGHRARILVPESRHQIGQFRVLPFPVEHDCADPFGFLISHPECGNVLFATDTGYLQYTFANLNNILIEANYSQEILENNIRSGRIPALLKKRLSGTHMELGVLLDIFKSNDLTQVNNIVLIHLSDGNSDGPLFKKTVEEATGKAVHIAEPGMYIGFNKTPF